MLAERIQSALDRVAVYSNQVDASKKTEITTFINKMKTKKTNCISSIERQKNKIDIIEDAVSKSSPENGLDAQMEPSVTSFVEDIEDIYSEINDNLASIKQFEGSLAELGDIEAMLESTDKAIADVSGIAGKLSKAQKRTYEKAKKMQTEAQAAFKNNKKKNAAKLTNDAYYSVIDLLPSQNTQEFSQQYAALMENIKNTKDIAKEVEKDKAKNITVFIALAQKRAAKSNELMAKDDFKTAQKELNLSGILITKAAKAIKEYHENNPKNKETSN